MNKSWQEELASKSVKKNQKLNILKKIIPDCEGKVCIEIGTEKGIVNKYLRDHKCGEWLAGTLTREWQETALELLKEDVVYVNPKQFDLKDHSFDIVLVSRPEHVRDDETFFNEVFRILKSNGDLFILSPHISRFQFLNEVKERVGLDLQQYDHFRQGYNIHELTNHFRDRFTLIKAGTYSRFFSEITELTINAGYTFINRRKNKDGKSAKEISYRPTNKDDMNKNKTVFKLYSMCYPFLWLVSQLDRLVPFTYGYVLYWHGRKVR